MLQRTIKTLLNFSSKPGFRDAVLESFYYDDAALRKALKAVKAYVVLRVQLMPRPAVTVHSCVVLQEGHAG